MFRNQLFKKKTDVANVNREKICRISRTSTEDMKATKQTLLSKYKKRKKCVS